MCLSLFYQSSVGRFISCTFLENEGKKIEIRILIKSINLNEPSKIFTISYSMRSLIYYFVLNLNFIMKLLTELIFMLISLWKYLRKKTNSIAGEFFCYFLIILCVSSLILRNFISFSFFRNFLRIFY